MHSRSCVVPQSKLVVQGLFSKLFEVTVATEVDEVVVVCVLTKV